MKAARDHWESVWSSHRGDDVSWFQAVPTLSLDLIAWCGPAIDDPIVDVGGGASTLAAHLASRGHRDVTVVDIAASSHVATGSSRAGDGDIRHDGEFVRADVLEWAPDRQYVVWHDRAVNHFLTDPRDRARYREVASGAVVRGGYLVLAAFAPGGPDRCSGLPVHRKDAHSLASEFEGFELVRVDIEEHATPWQTTQLFHYLVLRRH